MRRAVVVAALVLAGCVVLSATASESEALVSNEVSEFRAADLNRPTRVAKRDDAHLGAFHNRAGLMFRALDKDKDQYLSHEDIQGSAEAMAQHMPGVSIPTFLEFMSSADKDGDHRLSRDELFRGLSKGLQEMDDTAAEEQADKPQAAFVSVPASKEAAAPDFLETEATVRAHKAKAAHKSKRRSASKHRRDTAEAEQQATDSSLLETENQAELAALDGARRRGFLGGVIKAGTSLVNFGKGLLGGINKNHDPCVLCQYIVERAEYNVKQSGVLPGMASVGGTDNIFLETEVQVDQVNYDVQAAGIIGSTRQATRVQRQLERQKYNEIYRIVDLTLDDVCEQGFPPVFYEICKQVYKKQSDIVDGLRYQYRAGDICTRVGICSKTSYLTKGIHSRWKPNSLLKSVLNFLS